MILKKINIYDIFQVMTKLSLFCSFHDVFYGAILVFLMHSYKNTAELTLEKKQKQICNNCSV